MAIKIITPGCKPVYNAYCTKCGCHFTYEQEDIVNNYPAITWCSGVTCATNYVICPCCGERIYAYQYQPVWSNHGTGTVATIKMSTNTDDTDANINLT